MARERVLKEATIAENAARYKVLEIIVVLGASIVGIPFLLIGVPLSAWYWKRYYQHLRVTLTTRDLEVHRGIMVQEDKSIPLEKITDLAVFQGPIMRRMGLKGIRVETAGQSSTTGSLVSIIGLEDTDDFRDRVLAQRDRIADHDDDQQVVPAKLASSGSSASAGPHGTSAELAALLEIRDVLRRIDSHLASDDAGAGPAL